MQGGGGRGGGKIGRGGRIGRGGGGGGGEESIHVKREERSPGRGRQEREAGITTTDQVMGYVCS